jgi:beta-glucanase (GH16 family)
MEFGDNRISQTFFVELRMRHSFHSILFLVLTSSLAVACPAQNSATPVANDGWQLVWSDEFNRPNGSSVDPTKWVVETGDQGWGNNELEYYTASAENLFVEDGNLVIRALAEKHAEPDGIPRYYTSARIKTLGKFSQMYGRFEARIKVPAGQGMWPAFWMLGTDVDKVGWPACGEIDIMENIGKEPSTIHGSIHGPGFTGSIGIGAPYTLPGNRRFSDDFHVFALEWSPAEISFYVDHDLYVKRTPADLRQGWKWVFNKPFFLVLNLAVGGDWPGNPDATTAFPQEMKVDYVRAYKRIRPTRAQ